MLVSRTFGLLSSLCIPLLTCPSGSNKSASTSGSSNVVNKVASSTVSPTAAKATSSPVTSTGTTSTGGHWPGFSGLKYVFTFGNSYTTTGFDPKGAQPSAANPLGNPAYPGQTSSDGPNWVGFITTTYNQSKLLTYNMASGGATVDADLVKPFTPSVLSLKQQIQQNYLPIYGNKQNPAWTSDNTLFGFWIGINDVGNSYLLDGVDESTLLPKIFTEYSSLVQQVYDSGARNFVFINVPPVNRAPITVAQANVRAPDLENSAIQLWNQLLDQFVDAFKSSHTDATVFELDSYSLFNSAIDSPGNFAQTKNLVNTTTFCAAYQNGTPQPNSIDPSCGVPVNRYFWLNSLHPTFPVQDLVAARLVQTMQAVQPNIQQAAAVAASANTTPTTTASRPATSTAAAAATRPTQTRAAVQNNLISTANNVLSGLIDSIPALPILKPRKVSRIERRSYRY